MEEGVAGHPAGSRRDGRHKTGRSWYCRMVCLGSVLFFVFFSLYLWTARAEADAHFVPEWEPVDIEDLLDGRRLTDADYELLFQQTGLARPGVEQLWEESYGQGSCGQWEDAGGWDSTGHREGFRNSLLELQERFFAEPEIVCERGMFLVWSEWLVPGEMSAPFSVLASAAEGWSVGCMAPGQCFPALQDGDILISFSSHIFGWRSGHAGIVVDGEQGLTLEAIAVGYDSAICSLEEWTEYPSVAVLRLKGVSREERARVAAYAAEHLAGIPYRVDAFTWPSDTSSLSGTQCAHLVWAAYAHFGYDLDGDGGVIVTPADLYGSDLLEVVQVYGIRWAE